MLKVENRFINHLPADTEQSNFVRQVDSACYSFCTPQVTANPQPILKNLDLASELGLQSSFVNSRQFDKVFSGNELLDGMNPYAMCYGGHQFGHWAGQLGDGRAINLAEIDSPLGPQALQLKGAGMTPYSRHADGLAVLRSSIREYLCSEAMHHLGVPTTRALSLILTGDLVERDMFYDGNPQEELGAIVCRVSPSFIRFGSFEIFAVRNDLRTLKQLIDFCIANDFADKPFSTMNNAQERYLCWFAEIVDLSCQLVIEWQRIGFVHGVMNTDNMSILGLTIDYGPYGWIDDYDPSWTPNTTDFQGKRYCFGNQARIVYWNLMKLAQALGVVVEDKASLQAITDNFPKQFQQGYLAMMAKKLGLLEVDIPFVEELEEILIHLQMDMTIFFRALADFSDKDDAQFFQTASYLNDEQWSTGLDRFNQWLSHYLQKIGYEQQDAESRKISMNQHNPWFVLRNYITQQAIEKAEVGDYSVLKELYQLIIKPYEYDDKHKRYFKKRPDWAKNKPGCSMLSCSS